MRVRFQTAADRAVACQTGRHVPGSARWIDDQGLQRAVCHNCGCPLARVQVLRKWYRTGQLG